MGRTLVAGAAVLGVVIALTAYLASPYWKAHQLAQAFRNGDRDELAARIDFPSVRDSMKSQLNVSFSKNMASDRSMKNNPFAGLGGMLVSVVIDKMLDAYVTPDAFAALSKNGKAALAGGVTSPFASTSDGKFRTRYVNLNRFDILSDNDRGGQLDFVMRRNGLFEWRVERVELPEHFLDSATTGYGNTSTTTTTTSVPADEVDSTANNSSGDASQNLASTADLGSTVDIPRRYPIAFGKWQTEVPAEYKAEPFIASMDGTDTGLRSVQLNGRDMIFGTACKPHDCGPEMMGVLMAADQSEIVGGLFIMDDNGTVSPKYIGNPTTA